MTTFGTTRILQFFRYFSKSRAPIVHWAKKISRKITSKQVQNMFKLLWERLRAFLDFLRNFEFFSKFFPSREPPFYTGQISSEYSPQKHFQNMLKQFGGTFMTFFGSSKKSNFSKIFPSRDPP